MSSQKDAVKSDDNHSASSSDESSKEDKKSEDEDTSSDLDDSALSPDSSLRKAKPLLESVKKTLTAAAFSAAQKTDDMSGIGSGKTIPKSVATGCTPSPNKSIPSKGMPGASLKATPTKAASNTAKGVSGASSVPLVYKSPFLCSCGRNFDTKRGLSIHMSSNESHVPMDTAEVSLEQVDSKGSEKDDQLGLEEGSGDTKPVTTSTPSAAASDIAATSPGSPTHLYLSKTSARNPQYHSIIRTRRTSGIEGEAAAAASPAGKGSEGGENAGGPAANPSPAKGGKSLGGKKLSQVGGQGGHTASDADTQGSDAKIKKKSRDSSEQKPQSTSQQKSEESKGSSMSPAHQATKKPATGSASATAGNTSGGSATLAPNLQELALRNSPVTRSNAASLRTPHEFFSLPTRRKRGKKGSGHWRGSFKKEGSKQDSDDNMSEGVGEDFESPTEPPRSSVRSTRREAAKASASDEASASAAPASTSSKNLDISSDEASQQPKRKRGRPPKAKSSAPSTPHGNDNGSKGSPSSSGGKSGSVTRSGKFQKRAQSAAVAMGDAGEELDSEPAEESPLPLKSKSMLATSVKSGCNLEVSRKGVDKGKGDKETTVETESTLNKQKKEGGKTGTVASTDGSQPGKKDSPGKALLGKRAAGSGDKDRASLRPKKKPRRRKASSGSTRAIKVKKEVEEDEGEEEMEDEEEEEEEMEVEKEDQTEAASEEDPEEEEELEEKDKTVSKKRSGKKKQEETSSPVLPKTRSKSKAVRVAPKSKVTPKSGKGKLRKKSQSEAEEADTDVSMDTESKAAPPEEVKDHKQEEKSSDEAASALPAAKIPVSQQRQSSVIVSVLSGPAEKPLQQQQQPTSQNVQQNSEQTSKPPSTEGAVEQTNKDNISSVSVSAEKEFRPPDQPQPPTAQMFYPTSSPTTPTYGPFPYPASFPPPPHHPIMYHPGAHPPHPTGIYSPQFYPYPGSQPMQMPPHPNQFMPPQPPMNVTGHPGGGQASGNPEQQGASSPHAVQQQPQQQQQQTTQQQQQQAAVQQQPLPTSVSYSQGPQNTPVPSTSNVSVPLTATSVGGVRVSVMSDKSIPRAMVTLPYHMPSATPPRGPRPPTGPGGYSPMDISGMRPYIPGTGGPQSPEGMESHPHIHPPHPLQQVYRPPLMGGYPAPHLHPSAYGPMAIRMDHMTPYLDWSHVSSVKVFCDHFIYCIAKRLFVYGALIIWFCSLILLGAKTSACRGEVSQFCSLV